MTTYNIFDSDGNLIGTVDATSSATAWQLVQAVCPNARSIFAANIYGNRHAA